MHSGRTPLPIWSLGDRTEDGACLMKHVRSHNPFIFLIYVRAFGFRIETKRDRSGLQYCCIYFVNLYHGICLDDDGWKGSWEICKTCAVLTMEKKTLPVLIPYGLIICWTSLFTPEPLILIAYPSFQAMVLHLDSVPVVTATEDSVGNS